MSQNEHNSIEELKAMLVEQKTAFETYVKEDREWKESVTPSIEVMKKTINFSEGAIWFMKLVGLFAVAIGAVYGFIKYLKG